MSLEIKFSNNHGKYHAGDSVSGNIIIRSDTPLEVIGLKMIMFIQCRIVTSVNLNGKANTTDREKQILTENLNRKLFDREGDKLKVLPPGSHTIPFKFAPFPISYPHSFEGDKIMCRYFLRADLKTTSNGIISTKRNFKVNVLPLEENPDAQVWQVKSDTKILKPFPLNKISMKVTIPTGIDRRETVPIHISISNGSNHPAIKITSRLICSLRLPRDINKKDVKFIANEDSENINMFYGALTHRLNVHTGFSFDCPLIAEKFRIQVRMETSNETVLEVDFPVVVGIRRNGSGTNELRLMRPPRMVERIWGAPPSYEEAMQNSQYYRICSGT